MRCYLCDRVLSNDEIKHEPEYRRGGFSPCSHCLEVISEIFEPDSEEEIDQQLSLEGLWWDETHSEEEDGNFSLDIPI